MAELEECDVYDDVIVTGRNLAAEDEADYEEIDIDPIEDKSATTPQKLIARHRLYGRIQETMYLAAVNQPEQEAPKMKEKCMDSCCYSALWTDKIDYKTPVLSRARVLGWKIYSQIAFPLMRNNLRKFLVYSELLTILIIFVLSVITFVKGKNAVLDVVFLVIAIIGSLLAAVDTVFCLCTSCSVFKNCHKNNGGRTESENNQSTENTTTEESRMSDEEITNNTERRRTCMNTAVNKVDVLRIFVTELVLYPLLVCSVFKLVITEAYKFETLVDTLSFLLFLISTLSFGIYVYIVRFMIIIGVIYTTQKTRSPPPQPTGANNIQFDYSTSKSASKFQAYLVYHVSAQFVLQILMIISIAARIRHDNQNNFSSESMSETVSVSYYLWFMLLSGYFLPIFGCLTFFIVTFYWIQEFPVGLCIDLNTILQTPRINFSVGLQAKSKNWKENIAAYLNIGELKEKFSKIRSSSFIDKVCYPSLSPTMVILCVIFTGLQAAFIISIPREDFSFAGGEILTFIAMASFSIANLFTLTLTFFWIAIMITVLGAILAVIAVTVAILALGLAAILFVLVVLVAIAVIFGMNIGRIVSS